jgi:hypothetical protein
MAIALSRGEETLAVNFGTFDSERPVAGKGCTVPSMPSEDTSLKETIKHLEEVTRGICTSRHLLEENALDEDPDYLRLVAQLSGTVNVREAARREAHRLSDAG